MFTRTVTSHRTHTLTHTRTLTHIHIHRSVHIHSHTQIHSKNAHTLTDTHLGMNTPTQTHIRVHRYILPADVHMHTAIYIFTHDTRWLSQTVSHAHTHQHTHLHINTYTRVHLHRCLHTQIHPHTHEHACTQREYKCTLAHSAPGLSGLLPQSLPASPRWGRLHLPLRKAAVQLMGSGTPGCL
jgi:hypothetical protein